jgi:GNAT superfamily N-acetyltransferase
MITYGKAESDDDLEHILALQKKNLAHAIASEEEIAEEGFVTVSHTLDLLKEMNDLCAHIVAKYEDRVVGYALCMHTKFADDIDILKPMFEQIDILMPSRDKYIIMGQICIDKAFRKRGIFRKLYETMQSHVKPKGFDAILTLVDAKNTRSVQAHYAVGFELLKAYEDDSSKPRTWMLIGLK